MQLVRPFDHKCPSARTDSPMRWQYVILNSGLLALDWLGHVELITRPLFDLCIGCQYGVGTFYSFHSNHECLDCLAEKKLKSCCMFPRTRTMI